MAARKLYFETVRVGEELPTLAKGPIDRVHLARYAGASGDFNPLHVDEAFARGAGMPSVYAPGMLVMGFLSQLLSDWARGAQLRRYSVKFNKIVWPGDTLVLKGRVSDRWGEAGRYFAEVDLWVENQKGELVLKGTSQVQMFHSLEDENRQRAGQSPIVLEIPRENLRARVAATPVLPRAQLSGPPAEPEAVPKRATQGTKKAARPSPSAKKVSARPAAKKSDNAGKSAKVAGKRR